MKKNETLLLGQHYINVKIYVQLLLLKYKVKVFPSRNLVLQDQYRIYSWLPKMTNYFFDISMVPNLSLFSYQV